MNEYIAALIGGGIIGLAASILLVFHGKIMGVSGIIGSLFDASVKEKLWRIYFLVGIILGGLASAKAFPQNFPLVEDLNYLNLLIAGLFVGFGTQLGNGCTSGHGVCGISRFSRRSIFATIIFILSGMLTVALSRMWEL